MVTWSAQASGVQFGNPTLREIIGDNYWTLVREQKMSDDEKLYYYGVIRTNYSYSGNGIKFAEFVVEVSIHFDINSI